MMTVTWKILFLVYFFVFIIGVHFYLLEEQRYWVFHFSANSLADSEENSQN